MRRRRCATMVEVMGQLLAIDVGNTNTVLGIFEGGELLANWRLETNPQRTADEYAVTLHGLMTLAEAPWGAIDAAIVATVVPPARHAIHSFCRGYLSCEPLAVGPGIRTGMPILYENPREVGADRIVNAVAAYDSVADACVIVDFGTATTWDVVTPRGEYLGGAIAPGIGISADALYAHASKLPRVEFFSACGGGRPQHGGVDAERPPLRLRGYGRYNGREDPCGGELSPPLPGDGRARATYRQRVPHH